MSSEWSILMANQGLVLPDNLVFDPFVGTGNVILLSFSFLFSLSFSFFSSFFFYFFRFLFFFVFYFSFVFIFLLFSLSFVSVINTQI